MAVSGKTTPLINLSYEEGSKGTASNPVKYNNQDYRDLKRYHMEKGWLFVDSSFPPNSCSLGDLAYLNNWEEDNVEWLRPADIMKRQNKSDEPTFCMDGTIECSQGGIGNCWFLAALSSLTFSRDLMVQVVPMNQSFVDYAGIFHFRFWRFGKWVDVVIDDFLPTMNNELLSVFSKGGKDFWIPLLEKAYAKVCGSYADMDIGIPADACKDFTGGVSMSYALGGLHSEGREEQLWLSLTRATGCLSMICCGTPPKVGALDNTVSHNGLVAAHSYSVTAVTEVEYLGSKVRLVRLFNPWGGQEWNGKWSDKSDMWNSVSADDQQKRFKRSDGEFWMELEDFCDNFAMVWMSCENPNFTDGDVNYQWICMMHEGSWVSGKSAGGDMSEVMFETNPQYRIKVATNDKTQPGDKNLMLSLMQKPQVKRSRTRCYPIALTIVKLPPGTPEGRLELPFFYENYSVKKGDYYVYDRELIELHSVESGEYVIIPYTKKAYMDAEFVLTIYTKDDVKISVHQKHLEQNESVPPKISDPTDVDLRALFSRYADQNEELDTAQLQKLLNENFPHGSTDGFSSDVCKSMSALVDEDFKLTTTISEFSALWEKMFKYKRIFDIYDMNLNGALSNYELEKAVESAGIDVDIVLVKRLLCRYSDNSATSLRNFIILMIRLENKSSVFKKKAVDGKIQMNWEEWSNVTMYS
ncbi:calpain-1 catalytic subunit-like [Solea senegalensis]|uniref:Calpain-1 catalytic subunit-like n=1 Tax=Solea senegalensis TaxID=28829 RepID=A0AAV6SFT5_SOLSE|nr:calpain-A-like [Solea senegalensis]XP_043898366.1 calpain-A-like [Solea senegalensis]XP_043898367.1 calpain-A-like [Solea senegalensis]KAG7516254.1 calpain-1 catalytic subunit-like [Solea senegalensis]